MSFLLNPYIFGGSALDPDTILLYHFDGETGDTTTTDSSGHDHSPTFNGNAKIEENWVKFGQGSCYFDGTGDYLSIPDHDDWHFAQDSFTIETFLRFEALPSSGNVMTIIGQWDFAGGTVSWQLQLWNNGGTYTWRFYWSTTGTTTAGPISYADATIAVDTWFHIAVVHDTDANTLRLYRDGEMVASQAHTATLADVAEPVTIGAVGNLANYFQGWMDELRISTVARYTSDDSFKVMEYPIGNDPMTAHRYWRVRVHENQSGGATNACSVGEFTYRAIPGGADLTGSGTASASTELSGTYAASDAFANNGDAASNSWVSSNTGGTYGTHWLKYDFGSGNDVFLYEISYDKRGDGFGASEAITQAEVQWSDDDTNWTFAWSMNTTPDWGGGSENRVFRSPECPLTVFQCSFDGADTATSATDESENAHTITFTANAQLDTAQQKFGSASLLLDGTGDYVSAADDADWNFDGPFTLEGWFRFNTLPGSGTTMTFISQWSQTTENQKSWVIDLWNDSGTYKMRFLDSTDGSSNTNAATWTITTPSTGVWYHVCVDRDEAGTVRGYWDGAFVGSFTQTGTFHDSTTAMRIGALFDSGAVSSEFDGWCDEIRIQKGRAQYGTDDGFTPPTEAFVS